MLLTKKTGVTDTASRSPFVHSLRRGLSQALPTMDRRGFLRRSGLGVGVGLAASQLTLVKKAGAASGKAGMGEGKIEVKRTVCTHCSVGCAVDAVVENGVWVRQEPVFDSPINLGAHCAKGAALREHGHGEYRLRYPMKLVNGKYERISWDTALNEITARMLELRKASGPDSVYYVGSSKHNNEQTYLMRKFVSFWGSNNCDHQARICHSTTVAGVANTWGYGAMTNSYNDMQNSKCALYIGSNAAEAHPVSMLHLLHAKENGCKVIVVDPRFTRTAAKADEFVRLRSGSDIPFLFGVLFHIFKNNWEDTKYINDRVFGMEKVKEEVLSKWTPDKVEEACGVKEDQVFRVAKMMSDNRPSTLVWCMGQTQHTIGNAMVRASCILQLALGNVGKSGGGTNIFRGHDNVQGATDVGPNPDSLPGYYGIAEGSWKHFAKVWGVDYAAVLLGLYFALSMSLGGVSDPTFGQIQSLRLLPPTPTVVQPAPKPRLAQFLASEIKAGLVAVRDDLDRSVITIRGDGLFDPGSASLSDDREALMKRIAEALAQVQGQILVTGHTDNQPIRSVRFPSNWHLSEERAKAVRGKVSRSHSTIVQTRITPPASLRKQAALRHIMRNSTASAAGGRAAARGSAARAGP